jgi:hypothetical protein
VGASGTAGVAGMFGCGTSIERDIHVPYGRYEPAPSDEL